MTINLPTTPGLNSASPRPVDTGAWQQPIAGGTTTRLERFGAHLAMDFTTPKLTYVQNARLWLSRLVQAMSLPVRVNVPQPGITVGSVGNPVVDGGGQVGLALNVRGLTPGLPMVEGQALNVYDVAGRAYLHLLTADAVAGGGGRAALAVFPPVRAYPADGSAVNLAAPVMEGRLSGNEKGLTMKIAQADGLSFAVEELR